MIVLGIIIAVLTLLLILVMCVGYMGDEHGIVFVTQAIAFLIGLSLSSWCFGFEMFWYLPKLVW